MPIAPTWRGGALRYLINFYKRSSAFYVKEDHLQARYQTNVVGFFLKQSLFYCVKLKPMLKSPVITDWHKIEGDVKPALSSKNQ